MARSLYSISPSPGPAPLSPFSDDSSDFDGAPSTLTDLHDPRPGSPTRPGPPPPGLDVVTCQWEDCGSTFDDLTTFIRHLHEGAPLPIPTSARLTVYLRRSHRRAQIQLHL
jgi:hypothetical protein